MAIMRDIAWHLEQVEAPDLTAGDTLTLAFVRDHHLRCPNGSAEDAYITRLLKTSYRAAERTTRRAHLPQTWALVMDRFPSGEIVVPRPPLLAVDDITYIDTDGIEQLWGGSPLPYQVSAPVGPQAPRGRIRPVYGTSWPATRSQMDAVVVTFQAGYAAAGSPPVATVPEDIDHGRLLVIHELYKQRSESVHAIQNPAMIRARDLWLGYRAY